MEAEFFFFFFKWLKEEISFLLKFSLKCFVGFQWLRKEFLISFILREQNKIEVYRFMILGLVYWVFYVGPITLKVINQEKYMKSTHDLGCGPLLCSKRYFPLNILKKLQANLIFCSKWSVWSIAVDSILNFALTFHLGRIA